MTGPGTFVVATAGHVDHGKSTLLRALTGTDPDRLAEERRRGLTLDLGFVWTTAPSGRRLAFVDVPGHHRYLATTFAGVATAPAVLLVVSADEGWRAQTGEHLAAIEAFGVRAGLLVVTRRDLADPAAALAQARERTAGTGLEGAPAVAVSARTGEGLDDLARRIDALADAHPPPDADAPVRLWLDRAFTVAGSGTVVTGTLTAGSIAVDDVLELAPAGTPAAVRGLQCLGKRVPRVTGPARVAVNLRRVAATDVRRGNTLVTPGRWWRASTLDVRFERGAAPAERPPRPPAEPLVHCGTAATSARLRPLGPDAARLTLRTPLDLHVGDRLLVRDPGSRLLLGATVLDVAPPALRGKGAAAARARHLASLAHPADTAARLRATGLADRAELAAMGYPSGVGGREAEVPGALVAGPWLIDGGHAARLRAALSDAVEGHAAAHPADPGLPLAEAGRRVGLPDGVPPTALAGDDLVARDGRLYRAADAERLPVPVAAALDVLLAELREAPFHAPTRRRLDELGLSAEALALLVRRGRLERIGPLHLAPGAAARAAARLGALRGPFTVGACARALGTSRRVALPLLEALDAAGVTRRDAEGRRTVAAAPVPVPGSADGA
ncbi:selenocysteine-specific translation elongation factor [Streptomyces radicis]|uniref:Selenocysteine-specific translation elongation factor n=1 Tax=Streptomyces radicis TaxID=1750517 RepID=A0A3A9VUR3_9ACTN|nr:selenocysteine-specific translation elongation factor [Streptomyces radicis]RKN04509.1 selenocysteine-specific translation elongation factor [Streptomyces radicis]RKN15487.1 selenocysteine-specific translation elongation factor [Streptomyces radicis]